MKRAVSIVEARRRLGRLAEEVRRTGRPIALTRRGRVVAQIGPEPAARPASRRAADALATLRGSVRMNCSFRELERAVRELRGEFARSLERRSPRRRSSRPRG
jgi:prevent-host-death family protein